MNNTAIDISEQQELSETEIIIKSDIKSDAETVLISSFGSLTACSGIEHTDNIEALEALEKEYNTENTSKENKEEEADGSGGSKESVLSSIKANNPFEPLEENQNEIKEPASDGNETGI